jgi:multidrug resistance efflux pump
MQAFRSFAWVLVLGVAGGGGWLLRGRLGSSPSPPDPPSPQREAAPEDFWEVRGKTQPAPGRKGVIAPVPLHPVEEVKVKPGDRVRKDQVLVLIDADEPRADVRAKEAALAELKAGLARLKARPREEEQAEARAALEAARVSARQAREVLARLESVYQQGALPEAKYYEGKANLLKLEADERAAVARLRQLLKRPWQLEIAEAEARVASAQAALEAARAELEHYTVTAPIGGVITWLDVSVGTVSRPGTTVWGEVLDLSEIDVQCDVSPEQAERLSPGRAAQVIEDGGRTWAGEVVLVGVAADPQSGRVPVRVRVADAGGRLRCYVGVRVRFPGGGGAPAGGQAVSMPGRGF